MVVSDNTKQAESLGTVFKNLGKKGFNLSKKMFRIVLKVSGRQVRISELKPKF